MVWRSRKDGEEKVISSFSSLSFDVVTTATMTNYAPADAAEASAKDSSKEEAVDETAGGNGLFHERRTEEVK